MIVKVRTKDTMDVYVYRDAEHTSNKSGIFNIYIGESIIRIPMNNIFDIVEDYSKEEPEEESEENEEKLEASII